MVVVVGLYIVYDGNLDDGDCVVPDLFSTSGDAVVGRAQEICKSFSRVQQARQEAGEKNTLNLLWLLSSIANGTAVMPRPAFDPKVKCLEVQRNDTNEEVNYSLESSRARGRDLFTAQNDYKD